MQNDTQDGLETSKAILKDCVEASHLMLKRKLEAMYNGADVDWKDLQEVMREGSKATRQLAQIAALEARDRALKLREQKAEPAQAKSEPSAEPDQPRIGSVVVQFADGLTEWENACDEATDGEIPELPDKLKQLMQQFGVDPAREDSIAELQSVLEDRLKVELAA